MDQTQRFSELKREIEDLSGKKIRIEERFENEKKSLEKLLAEISSKGYDPKNLSEIKKQKEEQLKKSMEELEIKVHQAQEQLNSIEV